MKRLDYQEVRLKEKLIKGERAIGIITNVPSPSLAELLALSGFDFVMMDLEHGPISVETLENCARATYLGGSVPLARVSENNPKMILHALDAGCIGVMVPQVNTKEDAEKCTEAVRYAPLGNRGIALSTFAGRYGTTTAEKHLPLCNDKIMLIAQIESIQAYENLDQILRVEGIDALLIGPTDLSGTMGVPGQPNHPRVKKVVADIISRCSTAGKIVGTVAGTPEAIKDLYQSGAKLILAGVGGLVIGAGKDLIRKADELIQR